MEKNDFKESIKDYKSAFNLVMGDVMQMLDECTDIYEAREMIRNEVVFVNTNYRPGMKKAPDTRFDKKLDVIKINGYAE